ncbi:MAG: DUF4124 domain-containing protein, partial [Candidatus Accumulibacter sp.]|nr:DUF4124 domain-containing protein [Accumulibacter sp.]
MRPNPILLPLLAAALLLAPPAGAAIYQWKDASGKTVISDKPPPAGGILQKKDASAAPAAAGAAPSAAPPASWSDREIEFRKRQMEAREKADKTAKDQAAAADRERNCQNARKRLNALDSGMRIVGVDDKGERQYMDDA